MLNVQAYSDAMMSMIKTGGKLFGRNSKGVELYSIGDNVFASLKNGNLFKVVSKDVEKQSCVVFDFEKQLKVTTQRNGNGTANSISRSYDDLVSGTNIGLIETLFNTRTINGKTEKIITSVSAKVPEGKMLGTTDLTETPLKFSSFYKGHGKSGEYKNKLTEFFKEFRARMNGSAETKSAETVTETVTKAPAETTASTASTNRRGRPPKTKTPTNTAEKSEQVLKNETQADTKTAAAAATIPSGAVEKIERKISQYFTKLPNNSKMNEPLFVEHNGRQIGFIIDKTNPKQIQITVKLCESRQAWNAKGNPKIFATIDENNRMATGTLSYDRYTCYNFKRSAKNMRRITTKNGREYMPVSDTSMWTRINNNGGNLELLELGSTSFGSTPSILDTLFLRWTELYQSII